MTDSEKLAAIEDVVQKCYHISTYSTSDAISDIAKVLDSFPNADNGGAEEILFEHWKKWMHQTHQVTEELTMDDLKNDTSWFFFLEAMQTHAANEVAKAVKEKDAEIEYLKGRIASYQDTDADGYEFCGKCGKMK